MADSLTLLEQHPSIASINVVSFDFGKSQGVEARLNDGRRFGIRADTKAEAAETLLRWINEGKA